MSKNPTKIINVGINAGWFGGSAANQLNRKLQKNSTAAGEAWGVVQIIPNSRNIFMILIYGLMAIVTLGFIAPSPGYAVVLEKINS